MSIILPSFAGIVGPISGGGGGAWNDNSYALSFDGSDDYVEVADSDDFSFGDGSSNSAFSYSFWVRVERSSTNVFQHLISKGSSTNSEYLIQAMPPNSYGLNADSIYFALYPGSTSGAVVESPASSISLNTWHHVVCTADGTGNRSGMKIYIDGVSQTLTTSGLTSLTMINSTDPLRFGARSQSSAPNSFLQGKMDEIALFNSELSSSDVTSIYNSGGPDDLASLSPVGWWRMGDNNSGSGTTITDQGSGGNDGTLNNGPTFSTDVPPLPAWNGNSYALSLDGADDYLSIDHASSTSISGDMTISAWVNRAELVTSAQGGYFPILTKRPSSVASTNYQFYLDASDGTGGLRFYEGNAVGSPASATVITAGDWFHVAISIQSGVTNGTKWYVNGVQEASSSTFTINKTNTDPVFIGKLGSAEYYGKGLIDEVALFNSALTSSDITSIYNSGAPGDITSLNPVGWWRMGDNDSGTGTTITDQGSGGNNGTLTNGPTFSTDVPT